MSSSVRANRSGWTHGYFTLKDFNSFDHIIVRHSLKGAGGGAFQLLEPARLFHKVQIVRKPELIVPFELLYLLKYVKPSLGPRPVSINSEFRTNSTD